MMWTITMRAMRITIPFGGAALFNRERMRSIGEMFLTHLSCTACGLRHEWSQLQNLCTACEKPLFPTYDLAGAGRVLTREALATREKSLWRYREVLPLPLDDRADVARRRRNARCCAPPFRRGAWPNKSLGQG